MRILLLTCATGGGHLRAAAALEKYIRETTPHEVIQMDFLKSIGKLLDKTVCDSYLFMAKKIPGVFGHLYRKTNEDNVFSDLVPRASEMISWQLLPRINEVAPDVIISVHPFATEMVSGLKEQNKIHCPLICIMTDYGAHRSWLAPQVDAYVVASDHMVEELQRYGVPKEKINPYGIPVHDVFFDKQDQSTLLQEMGLEPNIPTVLFMAGSMGVSNIVDLYAELCDSPLELQMIIITGNNKKLYDIFSQQIDSSSKKTKLLPFTTEVERYMHASDLIVTKPGGLTVSEALACNLPLAVFDAIPGQEEENANFLQIHDMGVRITNDNFAEVISSLIEHKERLRRMRENCRAFDKSHANENIVALAEDLAKDYAAYNPALHFDTSKGLFRMRSAAVILQHGRLLVAKNDLPAAYLPGGGVNVQERAEDALLRELEEEMGIEAEIIRPLWITQRFCTDPDGRRVHEMCTYFLVDVSNTNLLLRGDRFTCIDVKTEHFEWIPVEKLPDTNIVPPFFKTALQENLPEYPQLITLTK